MWEPGLVSKTLGNGSGPARSVVRFTSATALANVELSVGPELQPYVTAQPAFFALVEANVPYEVRLEWSVPARAAEASFLGGLQLRCGLRPIPNTLPLAVTVDYGDVSIPPTTHVLSPLDARSITSVSATSVSFSSLPPELAQVAAGEVLALGITAATPHGLLRRVEFVDVGAGQTVITTTPAAIEDALETATLSFSSVVQPSRASSAVALARGVSLQPTRGGTVRPSTLEGFYLELDDFVLYDDDGDEATTDDQVTATGSASIDPRFEFSLSVQDHRLDRLSFVSSTTQTMELELAAQATLLEFDVKREFVRFYCDPVVVWAGWLPLVIEPVLTGNVGAKGELTAGITTSVTAQSVTTAGLSYDQGTWTPISGLTTTFGATPPALSLGCDAKAYVGPQLSLLLFGAAGPYVDAGFYGQLVADLLATPWWQFFGGVEVGVGVRVEALGRTITEYYAPAVVGYRRLLLQADTPPPAPGSVAGAVRDAVSGTALPGVSVAVKSGGMMAGSGSSNASGAYAISVPEGRDYVVEFTKAGYLAASHHAVEVRSGQPTFLEVLLQVDTGHAGPGTASGFVQDALTGAGVAGLQLALRRGVNVRSGAVVASATTLAGGSFSVSGLEAGQYTVQAGGTGYVTTFFTIVSIGGVTTANQNGTITPVLPAGETRIVLTWGPTPSDLDSHLTGPLPGGTRFHMYYGTRSSNPWPTYVTLDRDDVGAYGPETTTILQQIPGAYRFSVHDYTNRSSTTSSALSGASAQVRVYRGGSLVASFNVPPARPGTLWTVFEMTDTTITPVNTLTFQSSPPDVQSRRRTLRGPVDWRADELPAKR